MKKRGGTLPYEEQTHLLGKIWVWGMGLVLLMFPTVVCLYYNAWPDGAGLLKGLLAIAPMETEVIWDRLYQCTYYYARGGAGMHAISGIDMSLTQTTPSPNGFCATKRITCSSPVITGALWTATGTGSAAAA